MCCTELSSPIGNFDCGNVAIFLPLWFYVKSILADFWRSKTAVLTILYPWILIFGKNSHLKCQKFPKIENSELFKWSKWSFGALKWLKLISRKILKFSHCVFPIRLSRSVDLTFEKNWVTLVGNTGTTVHLPKTS